MNSLRFVPTAFLLLGAVTVPAVSQSSDQGVLLIRSGDRDVGSETFKIVADSGLRITTKAVFGSVRPALELTASLDQGQGFNLAFQLDRRAGAASGQVYAVQKRNRITVRRVNRGAEQASEFPGGPRTILLADSVFALYLQLIPLATDAGQSLTALFPHSARRVTLSAQRVPNGAKGTAIRLTGEIEGEIQLGDDGLVQRISLPALGLDAVRRAE